jgi:hypothetical protein
MLAARASADRTAFWTEALAVARDDRVLVCWTVSGPRCVVAAAPADAAGHFWVDGLLQVCEPGPNHWEKLTQLFADFWRAEVEGLAS